LATGHTMTAKIKEQIIENLKTVYDPEISVNVYDLGLIYGIDVAEAEVTITHTLTSAFCPFADEIVNDIRTAGEVSGIEKVHVNTVFEPPFSIDMVPEEVKLEMGWL